MIIADVEVDIALDKVIKNKLDDFSIGRLRYFHIRRMLQSSIVGNSNRDKARSMYAYVSNQSCFLPELHP
ncbi:MAG: hypothetical protein GY820_46565 [Gammaproteobacteria bacterium]|nr:hypothetical protein [Gammaproteobacteria bacterium]